MRAFFLAVCLLAGCSGSKDYEASGGGDTANGQPPDGDTGSDEPSDENELPRPRWWTMAATLWIQDGAVVPEQSYLTIRLWDEEGIAISDGDAESGDTESDPGGDTGDTGGQADTGAPDTAGGQGGPLCTQDVELVSAAEAEPPHASVLAWWAIETGDRNGACGDAAEALGGYAASWALPLEDELYVGIGQMHADIQALAASAYPDPGALNGAYAALEDPAEELLVFGAAGTAESFQGEGAAADAAPLPDGAWLIDPLYTFSYE